MKAVDVIGPRRGESCLRPKVISNRRGESCIHPDATSARRGESRIRLQMQNEAIFTGDHKDRPYKEHASRLWNEGLAA